MSKDNLIGALIEAKDTIKSLHEQGNWDNDVYDATNTIREDAGHTGTLVASPARSEISANEAPITLKDFKEDSLAEAYLIKTPTAMDNKYLNISIFLWAAFLNTWKPEISRGKQWGSLPMFDRFMREWIPTLPKREETGETSVLEIEKVQLTIIDQLDGWDNPTDSKLQLAHDISIALRPFLKRESGQQE